MKNSFVSIIMFLFASYTLIYAQQQGPVTSNVNPAAYSHVYYVAVTGNDSTGTGMKNSPWRTINFAINNINNNNSSRSAIFVSEGKYSASSIILKQHIDLYGGFDPKTWNRNIFLNETIINADSGYRTFIASDNCLIDGFSFRKNVFRGRGAVIYCNGTSPTISNNTFVDNKTLKPENWHPKFWHEQANDGGCIECENHSFPVITNNMFYKNGTENGRGGGISLNNHSGGKIVNNVFMYNITGTDDPARSSDGGGVAIFNWCNPLVDNNIFVGNQSLTHNDAGALFVALWSSPTITRNIFVGSKSGDDAGALFVGGQEHRYNRPLDPMPPKDKYFVKIDRNLFVGNQNPSQNSGVMRFTMESRGSFTNNICFNNNGLYFQRCEAQIYNNTVIENFLLIETKADLGKNYVTNNIIWGNMNVDAPSVFSTNDLKFIRSGKDNFSKDPLFKNDGMKIFPIGVSFDNSRYETNLYVSGLNLKPNSLKGRVIYAGKSWGVVKSNDENNIELWGNFSGQLEFYIVQTLTLSSGSPCIDAGTNLEMISHDYYENKRPEGSKFDIGGIESK